MRITADPGRVRALPATWTREVYGAVSNDLDEAIALGQWVVLMAAGPGRIQRVIGIDLPYPREHTSDVFARIRRDLFAEFHLVHQEAATALARDELRGSAGGAPRRASAISTAGALDRRIAWFAARGEGNTLTGS